MLPNNVGACNTLVEEVELEEVESDEEPDTSRDTMTGQKRVTIDTTEPGDSEHTSNC